MTDPESIALHTIDALPDAQPIGAVRFWARDTDLARADEAAYAGLREQAAAAGADAVIGLRVELVQETHVGSAKSRLSGAVLVSSEAAWCVYVYGTVVRLR